MDHIAKIFGVFPLFLLTPSRNFQLNFSFVDFLDIFLHNISNFIDLEGFKFTTQLKLRINPVIQYVFVNQLVKDIKGRL